LSVVASMMAVVDRNKNRERNKHHDATESCNRQCRDLAQCLQHDCLGWDPIIVIIMLVDSSNLDSHSKIRFQFGF
jgi:hypothetical protein